MVSSLVRLAGGPLSLRGRRRLPALASAGLPLVAVALLMLTQAIAPIAGAAAAQRDRDSGVATLTGSVTITSPFLLETSGDPYVLLRDVGELFGTGGTPPSRQTIGGVEGDVADEATYTLSLPIAPQGTAVDLVGDGGGVQIYFIQLITDAIDDPFLGPWDAGWGLPVSSLQIADETQAWSGTLVVWAPDDEQSFPTSAGQDGQAFSGDDPVGAIPAGWTVVQLDDREFDFQRAETVDIPLREAADAHQDLSDLGYTEAFDVLVEDLRSRYAFKDVKEIDFDAIVEQIRPLVEEAERDEDPEAFHVALMRFGVLFGDGHVSVGTRDGYLDDYLDEHYGGSPGLTIGETDAGEVIVVTVRPGSPADEAGIEPGAEILRWNGESLDDALNGVEHYHGASSPHGLRAQQLDLLPRMAAGEVVALKVRNPESAKTLTLELEAAADPAGFEAIRTRHNANLAELPVTARVLPSGVGYIRVNTFMSDLALMFDSWEWSLRKMEELEVPALVLDVRGNGGGWGQMATYFVGSFTDEEFVVANEFAADDEGEFQPAGTTAVSPSPIQWTKPVAVLIDHNCASACEIFSAAMAHNPDVEIVGHTPTAGVEAGVLPWTMPEEIYFQASVYLMTDDGGEVFLEGAGVPPTLDVPVTIESLLSPEDEVLLAADEALLDEIDDRQPRV